MRKHLTGKDLAYLRVGLGIFYGPMQMSLTLRRVAMRSPKHWVWKYGWPLVEEAIVEIWSKEEVRR